MGRIRGKSFWTRRTEDYKSRDVGQEQFEKNMKNVGSILKLGTQLYTNPMIRDAVGGLEDLFQGSPEEKKDVVKTAAESEVSNLKKAALARRQAEQELDKTAPVQMPTTDAKGQQELEALEQQAAEGRAIALGNQFDPDREPYRAVKRAKDRERKYGQMHDATRTDRALLKPDLEAGREEYEIALDTVQRVDREIRGIQELMNVVGRLPEDRAELQAQIDEALRYTEGDRQLIKEYEGFLAEEQLISDDAQVAWANKQEARRIGLDREKNLDEHRWGLQEKARKLTALASKKAAELNQSTEEAIASAVNKILDGGTLSDEEQVKFDAMKSKLQVDEETGDIMLNVTTEERVAISNDPEMSVYLAAATKQLEQELQQPIGGARTGDALADALAGASIEETPGPTGAGEEVATTPAAMPSLISDEDLTTSSPAEKNEWIDKIQTRLLTKYGEGSPRVNDVINEIRSQINSGRVDVSTLGKTPAEIERSLGALVEFYSGSQSQQQVPQGGMEVPSIAGRSLQEAQMIAMEIGQNPNISFKAKQAAMRELLKQVSSIEDVTSDWASNYGTAGYVGTSAAATSLMNAFSGQIPKAPKTASEYQKFTMEQKARAEPGKLEKTRLGNIYKREQITSAMTTGPLKADKMLLDNLATVLNIDKLKIKKGGGGRRISATDDEIDKLRKEILSGANSTYKWLSGRADGLDNFIKKTNTITVKDVETLDNNAIANQYGARLDQYLDDIRNAKDAAEKASKLKALKSRMKSELLEKQKRYVELEKKIPGMIAKLQELGLKEDKKPQRIKMLKELNRLLQTLREER